MFLWRHGGAVAALAALLSFPGARVPRIEGRVHDRTGAPISGARVLALPGGGRAEWFEEGAPPSRVRGRAETDREGRFTLELDGGSRLCDLIVGADGFAPAAFEDARAGDKIAVLLRRPGRLAGSVLTDRGEPLSGAWISVATRVGTMIVRRHAASGPRGAYIVDGLPTRPGLPSSVRAPWRDELPALPLWIGVGRSGYAPLHLEEHWPIEQEGETRRVLVLGSGSRIMGRVRDAETLEGLPGARVLVELKWTGYGVRRPADSWRLAEQVTDGDGRWSLDHLPTSGFHHNGPGGLRVTVEREGYASDRAELPVPECGEPAFRELRLWPAAEVAGRVVDPRGAGVAGVTVGAQTPGEPHEAHALVLDVRGPGAVTGPDGRYLISGARCSRRGPTRVQLRSRRGEGSVEDIGWADVELRAGDRTQAPDLVIAPLRASQVERSAEVLVEDQDGAPIEGAIIGWVPRTITDEQGRARIRWIADSLHERELRPLDVRARGFAGAVVSIGSETDRVEVRLRKSTPLSGRVIDENGAPVPGAFVGAVQDRDPRTFELSGLWAMGAAVADEHGWFELADLPDGPYEVGAVRHGMSDPTVVVTAVPTGSKGIMLRLPALPAGVPVQGRVIEAGSCRPIARFRFGITWSWTPEVRGDWEAVEPGVFRALRVPEGPSRLLAEARSFRPATVDFEVFDGMAPVEVQLGAGVTARVRVRVARGEPVAGRLVTLLGGGESEEPHGVTDAFGEATVPGLEPGGRYEVVLPRENERASPLAFPGGIGQVMVPVGRTAFGVELLAVEGATLEVQLERTMRGSTVELLDASGTLVSRRVGLAATAGHHVFQLTAGSYTVRVPRADGTATEHAVAIPASARAPLRLSLKD
jgi:hypothetical protein